MFALIAALAVTSSASAATVTVGSPMTASFPSSHTCFGGGCNLAIAALPESGANVTSPVSGTIVEWRFVNTGTGSYTLRVLRPAGGGQYTAAGSGSTVVASGPGMQSSAASLPIQAGD